MKPVFASFCSTLIVNSWNLVKKTFKELHCGINLTNKFIQWNNSGFFSSVYVFYWLRVLSGSIKKNSRYYWKQEIQKSENVTRKNKWKLRIEIRKFRMQKNGRIILGAFMSCIQYRVSLTFTSPRIVVFHRNVMR